MIKRTIDDIKNAIKATGAIYGEELEDGTSIFTSKPLSEEKKSKYHNEAKENVRVMVDNYTKEIDKQILKEILKIS